MTLKNWLRYPIDIRRARALLAARTTNARDGLGAKPIVLDLRTDDFVFDGARHLAAIAMHAIAIGSPCVLKCSSTTLATIARKPHGRRMLRLGGLRYLTPNQALPSDSLILSDTESDNHHSIWMRAGTEIENQFPVMPYPMHPATLDHYSPDRLTNLRDQSDRTRLFFAGNQKPSYGQGKIGRRFGICNRIEMLTTTRRAFSNRICDAIDSSQRDSIVLSDSRSTSIAASDWLPTLARTHFFLCCPGSSQPVCHHLVEAMSVGTIPVLEYADRITPRLVNGETAITFSGRGGLVRAIRRIDAMSEHEVATMRANVVRFFDDHLCQRQFLQQLRDGETEATDRKISLPFHHENFYPSFSQTTSARLRAA